MKLLLFSIILLVIALFISEPTGFYVKRGLVSIVFDDGLVSEYEASRILDEYGYKGTFYVMPGLDSFEGNPVMSIEQLRDLYSRGHEIGCHTLAHANLSTMSSALVDYDLRVCKELLSEFNTESFAYPYGAGVEHEEIVKRYFNSARLVEQGVNSEINFNIKTLILVHDRMERLEWLSEWLSQGWVVITIHGVTEEPRGLIDITPNELRELLDLIKASGAEVRTVKEVINANKLR